MIQLKHLYKQFNDTIVFSDLSLSIPTQKMSYLNGKSGIGKTTLLRILSGLEDYNSGYILGLEDKKISMVFQENRLIENISIYANIVLPHLPNPPIGFQNTVLQAMHMIDLNLPLNTKVSSLSGGMKRRVTLLRALLASFDLLILDEPFTGLDSVTKYQVIALIKQHTLDKTVILVTHDQEYLECFDIQNIITLS